MTKPIDKMTDLELTALLLTCDGAGKERKAEALDELRCRAMQDARGDMIEAGYILP